MGADITFTRDHDRVIRSFAFKVLKRAHSAGASSVSMDDIYQELCIAWCRARDAWDAQYGVPFLAFLNRGMHHHINRWVQSQIDNGRCVSLEAPVGGIGEEGTEKHDRIPDENGLAGIEEFELADFKDFVSARLSPRARTFLQLIAEPPQFLRDAVRQGQARASAGRARDINGFAPARVTAAMVFDFMDATNRERVAIYKELRKVIEIAKRLEGQ